jgi:hypothetical protein
MAFDFDTDVEVGYDVVRAVASEIAGGGLKPLSPEEIAQREIERETRQEQDRLIEEQRRRDYERDRAAKAEAEQAEWLAEHRKQEAIRQHERAVEIDRLTTQRTLSDLQMAAARQNTFQRDVRTAHVQSVRQQYTTSLMAELDRAINEAVPLKPSPNFATLYRENQRSGWYYVEPEDSDGGDK